MNTTHVEYGLEAFLASGDVVGRVGLVTNATGRDRSGTHLAELLARHPRLKLVCIFTPEHGFGADAPDGEAVSNDSHASLRVPIVSLYGPKKMPSPEDLTGLDLLIYDIQDVGVRFYTYISTLRNVIDAAAPLGIPLHVLDRPDLMGGITIEGPMLSPGFSSFVGHLPLPIRYGLTAGELALWWNHRLDRPAPITVWPCRGWRRGTSFDDWNTSWVKPSPSMISPATAAFYPGTCLFEGTNLSEGRGTDAPFQTFGAPWVDADRWREVLVPTLPSDIQVSTVTFIPTFSKFVGEPCRGIRLNAQNPLFDHAFSTALHAIAAFMKTHPDRIEFSARPNLPHPFFDHLVGCAWVREGLQKNVPVAEIVARANEDSKPFSKSLDEFYLYK
ncbi:MAG: DUF1343 domain-containing protein [Candidatus Ozemobacteraceae bacterium]